MARTLDEIDDALKTAEAEIKKLTKELRKSAKATKLEKGKGDAGRTVTMRVHGKTVRRAVASIHAK